jgi:hypothetical protein
VIENNQLMAHFPLFILQVNEVVKVNWATSWFVESNFEDFGFPKKLLNLQQIFFQKFHNGAKFCTKENGCKEPIIWRKLFDQFSSLDSLKQHSKIYVPDLYPSVLSLDSVTGSGHRE